MSVSLWAYDPDKCEGNVCPGDCDICHKWEDDDDNETMVVPCETA